MDIAFADVLPVYLEIIAVSLLGLCFGSFATAITQRGLRDIPWIFAAKRGGEADLVDDGADVPVQRSVCLSCKHVLSPLDLVPLLSWLFLRGRCRYCGAPIGGLYPVIELSVLLSALLIYWVHDFTPLTFLLIACSAFLTALVVIDFKRMILPDDMVLSVAFLGALAHVVSVMEGDLTWLGLGGYLLAGLVYGGLIWGLALLMGWLLNKEALGGGDVKFFAVSGVWLGLEALPDFFMLSGVLGVVLGVIWQVAFKRDMFPFGPALIVSLYGLQLIGSFLAYLM